VSDADAGDTLRIAIVSAPSHGTVASTTTAGTWKYTPALNHNGVDSFVYRVIDASGAAASATVSLTVRSGVLLHHITIGAGQKLQEHDTSDDDRLHNSLQHNH
jgi:VCBS repeat-containing protein